MRKEYGKAIRTFFGQKIQDKLPDFSPAKISNAYFFPGDRAFEKRIGNDVSYWINLNINQKFESFTIEIGWSTMGRWPQMNMRPSPIRPDYHCEFEEREYMTRLPFLWTMDDYWFEIEPFNPGRNLESLKKQMQPIEDNVAYERIVPVVEECTDKIVQYAIPYFQEHAKRNV